MKFFSKFSGLLIRRDLYPSDSLMPTAKYQLKSELTFKKGQRGNLLLIYEGFTFFKHSSTYMEKLTKTYWRCSTRVRIETIWFFWKKNFNLFSIVFQSVPFQSKTKCKAVIATVQDLDGMERIETKTNHNHYNTSGTGYL
jgi:hypothetical protein